MDFERQISRRLHEEHRATLDLWGRLEQALGARARSWPPAAMDADLDSVLRAGAAALAHEVSRHFDFEEAELFPRLAEAGEGDIAALLEEEHEAIRSAAATFSQLLTVAASGSLDASGWQRLRTVALELVERLVAHVQKEEMSLLPALEDLLDEETDAALVTSYAEG